MEIGLHGHRISWKRLLLLMGRQLNTSINVFQVLMLASPFALVIESIY